MEGMSGGFSQGGPGGPFSQPGFFSQTPGEATQMDNVEMIDQTESALDTQEAVEPFRSEKRALLSLLSLDISLDNMISVMTGSAHVVVPIVDPAKKRNLSFFVAFVFRVARRPKGSPIELFSI